MCVLGEGSREARWVGGRCGRDGETLRGGWREGGGRVEGGKVTHTSAHSHLLPHTHTRMYKYMHTHEPSHRSRHACRHEHMLGLQRPSMAWRTDCSRVRLHPQPSLILPHPNLWFLVQISPLTPYRAPPSLMGAWRMLCLCHINVTFQPKSDPPWTDERSHPGNNI